MRIKAALVLIVFVQALFANPLHATEPETDLHPNTPYEYWADYCGYPDVIPNLYEIAGGSLSRMLDAEVMLARVGQLVQRTDDPNFWHFVQTDTNINFPGTTIPIGGQVPFYGETRLAPNGRSGILIAPNIVATAPHTTDFNPADFIVVFNVKATKNPTTGACVPPDPEHIPAGNVYFPRAVNPLIANTLQYYFNIYGQWTGVDYAAFYLDRAVPDHQYVRIRKTGSASSPDVLAMAGHPFRMRTKLQYGMSYAGDETNFSFPDFVYPTFNDFYLLDGESGSAVYNLDRNYVETLVGSVIGFGCLNIFGSSMYDLCDDIPESPPYTGTPTHDINQGPISTLANLVPTPYLRVDPLNDVTYILPINGSPYPAQTLYTAKASATETVNTQISVSISPTSTPILLTAGSYNSSLAPGASTTVAANAMVPTGTPCGVYDRSFTIVDQTHGFRDRMLHRFEIGMTDYDVTPTESQDIYGASAPSVPAQLNYTLTNTRPTPVSLTPSFDQTWVSLAPVIGGSPTINLAAAGQAGATKTISVRLTSAAYSLPAGDHPFTMTLTDKGGCSLNGPTQRSGVFHKGTLLLSEELDEFVPIPSPPSNPVTSTFTVDESFCIGDASFMLDNAFAGTVIGIPLVNWAPHLSLTLEHTNASGTTSISLWANNPVPAGWTIPTYYDPDLAATVETLLLDNHANLPPTGARLSQAFNGDDAQGQWTFKVVDDGLIPGRNEALLTQWQLELKQGSCLSK